MQRHHVNNGTMMSYGNVERIMTAKLGLRACRTPDCSRVVGAYALYEDVNKKFSLEMGWAALETTLPQPFEINPMEEKGRGMVATREIKRGELIVRERPVLMAPRILISTVDPWNANPWKGMEEVLAQLLYWLEQADREKVVQLHNCKSLDECGPLAGLLRTNAIGVMFPESQMCSEYCALCLNISYANHSCAANAFYSIDNKTLAITFFATRDIMKGEEITLSYLEDGLRRTDRQAELQTKYGFTCKCALCAAPSSVTHASDERRKYIETTLASLSNAWKDWLKLPPAARNAQTKRTEQTVEKLLHAMDEEKYLQGRTTAIEKLCYMYATLCDVKKFKKWGSKTVDIARVQQQNETVKLWEGWLKDPKTYPMWDMWRVTMAQAAREHYGF